MLVVYKSYGVQYAGHEISGEVHELGTESCDGNTVRIAISMTRVT